MVVLYLVLYVFSNSAAFLTPYIFGEFLNDIQRRGVSDENIFYLLSALASIVLVTILFWVFHGVGRVIERKNAFRVREKYKNYLLEGLVSLGVSWHADRDSGDTIDKVNKASEGLYKFSTHVFQDMEIIARVLGPVAILYIYSHSIALAILAFTIGSVAVLFQFDRILIPQYKRLNEFENRIEAKIFDALSNITTVKILSISKPVLANIATAIRAPFSLYSRNAKLIEWKWFTGSVLFDLVVVVPLGFFILQIYNGSAVFEIGTISALYLYLNRMSQAFFGFAGHYENTMIRKARVQNAQPIEDAFTPLKTRQRSVPGTWRTLHISDFHFVYENVDSEVPHLDIDALSIKRGERVACIGESGSGKTTLLSVLHGLFPSARARVAFGKGTPFKTSFANLKLKTMLVPQEPEVFSASIRENITLGLDYTEDQIRKMTDLAQFTDVIAGLPRGLDSVINEKGVNLSGGQKQRLALARALLLGRDKDIVLLDESTSSVDPENESRIYENIFAYYKGKTILASIHKMNLLKYFDRIIMFRNGRVFADGTFDELMTANDTFRKNWEEHIAQSKK